MDIDIFLRKRTQADLDLKLSQSHLIQTQSQVIQTQPQANQVSQEDEQRNLYVDWVMIVKN
jgi:hypothetical protein